jgi:hypothetical protein
LSRVDEEGRLTPLHRTETSMNRLKKRAWLPKVWALVAIGLALASQACSNTCADYESAINNCGGSFNRQKCDQNIGQCTSADIKTIENAASCMQNPSVCSNGKTVDVGKFAACDGPVLSVSQNCLGAF